MLKNIPKKTTKYIYWTLIVITLFVLWYLTAFLFYKFPIGSVISDKVNKKSLLSLKIGMHEGEVKKVLGEPLAIKETTTGIFFIYAKPGLLGAGLEVSLRMKGKYLYGIYVEKSDLGIYFYDQERRLGIIDQQKFDKLLK